MLFTNSKKKNGDGDQVELQPKTKVVGKLCKTLKIDPFFGFQLNLRRV